MTDKTEMRVWWIPQAGLFEAFETPVSSVEEGVKIMDVLAGYDQFQLKHHIKPDYCNTGGLQVLENGEWLDWIDDETGEDDPREFIRSQVAFMVSEGGL